MEREQSHCEERSSRESQSPGLCGLFYGQVEIFVSNPRLFGVSELHPN